LLVVTPLYLARRRRDRRRLAAMVEADAVAAQNDQNVLDELLDSPDLDEKADAGDHRTDEQSDGGGAS